MKTFHFLGLTALAAATLHGVTMGPVYWSTSPMTDCSDHGLQQRSVTIPGGGTGYSCYVAGTFVWLAAGGPWGTSIRVAAPASGDVAVYYSFYAPNGSSQTLDSRFSGSSSLMSRDVVGFSLFANQPTQVELLGATSDAPHYRSTATGTVYAEFYCPNARSCLDVLPQLLYSALPTIPWSLSVPIQWDCSCVAWSQWSAEGIDDYGTHRVSLVIYNQSTVAAIYTVRVYDSTGTLAGMGTSPVIPRFGTFGDVLSNIVTTPLPPGLFKVLVDGGSNDCFVLVLQVNGQSATTLQVAYDTAPSGPIIMSVPETSTNRERMAPTPSKVLQTPTK